MAKLKLHQDFKEFLKLLTLNNVEYLLVGGYAVAHYGYPRATGDMDIWIAVNETNALKISNVIIEFGMPKEIVDKKMFLVKDKVIRMGNPPVRIEVITGVSGLDFDNCYSRKVTADIDELSVYIISLNDLKINKKAAGRHKDLDDLEHLP